MKLTSSWKIHHGEKIFNSSILIKFTALNLFEENKKFSCLIN